MIFWEKSGADSFYAYVSSQRVTAELIDSLYKQGKASPSGRARLCLHSHPSSTIQVMLIYHDSRTMVPIHKHAPFGEFISIVAGEFELLVYDNDLIIQSTLLLSSESGGDLFCSVPANVWHSLRFTKPTVFLEISQGPFDVKITEFAPRT